MKIKKLTIKHDDCEYEDEINEFVEEYGQLPRDRNELLEELVYMIDEVGE